MILFNFGCKFWFLNALLHHSSSSLNGSVNILDSVHESSDSEIDCDALINDSDVETQSTSVKSGKNNNFTQQSNLADFSSDFKVQCDKFSNFRAIATN